jgi:hypothetical protein
LSDSYERVSGLAIGQLDGDAALEIAALVDGDLRTWDGITRQPEFSSNAGAYYTLPSGDWLLVTNLDADAVDEVVVVTNSSGWQLLVLNGASNIIQKSLPVSGILVDFAAADLNGNSSRELAVATENSVTIYDTTSWGVLGSVASADIEDLDATSAGGGTVAISTSRYHPSPYVKLYEGATLAPSYQCGTPYGGTLAFGEIGDGQMRLLVAGLTGIAVLPLDGASCPGPDIVFDTDRIHAMTFADVTGDGRNDLLIDARDGVAVALLGLSSELRGDADGDETVTTDDIDATADYLFGVQSGASPSADANADRRISVEDVFTLIDHEFAGGAPLQP